MAKTIKELRREIAIQKRRIAQEQNISTKLSEKQELSRQLFELKNRKLIGAGAKAKRLSKRFGRGVLSAGQKAAPVIKKQAGLIRDQQLRDDAIERAREKRFKKSKKKEVGKRVEKTKDTLALGIFEPLDF